MIARVNYIVANGTFYQTIGRVLDITLYFLKPGNLGETVALGAFEVLTCQPRAINTATCGTLLQFTANNITELGFNSGTYYDNSIVYVGTGYFFQCGYYPGPARVTTSINFSGAGAWNL